MIANIVSLIIMISGPLLAVLLILFRIPSKKKIVSSFVAGLFVAISNSLIEIISAHYDVYYVFGLWPILNSPFSRTIGWLFLGMVFVLGSDFTRASRNPRTMLFLYILSAIIVGLTIDYLGTRWLEFMSLGKNGNWLIIIAVWSSLVPGAILVYKIFLRHLKNY